MNTITIKLPLHEPTKIKVEMFKSMRSNFSNACNRALAYNKEHPNVKASELDRHIQSIPLPSTLHQEARKLAVSRYRDWKKNTKTKGFPSFREKISMLFNNQNWRLRFDKGHLKVGFPTLDEGNLKVCPAAGECAYALLGELPADRRDGPAKQILPIFL